MSMVVARDHLSSGFRGLGLIVASFFWVAQAHSSCTEFEAEAEAYEGVVPKLDDNGSLRALVIYGEGTFIAPKRSLITAARREAELTARRAYSEFLNSQFESSSEFEKITQTYEKTNSEGMTEGQAEELKKALDYMSNSSSSVQSGLVKLDECVDTDGKYLLVEFGWKPSLSVAAGQAAVAMQKPASSSSGGAVASTSAAGGSQGGASNQTTVRKGSIDYITVEVTGLGSNVSEATSEALRLAVSQVHGAKFASSSQVSNQIASLEASGSLGSFGAAVETKNVKSSTAMETSGIIESWRYLGDPEDAGGEVSTAVSVTLIKFVSSVDPSKRSVVVAEPAWTEFDNVDAEEKQRFNSGLMGEIQSALTNSTVLQVVDRESSEQINKELAIIGSSQNIEQLAKLGQTVGADFILVPSVDSFSHQQESRQVGNKTFERSIFNVTVTMKVVEVATSNAYDVSRFPFKNRKIRSSNPVDDFSSAVAKKLSTHVITKFGGKYQPAKTQIVDMTKVRKKANEDFEDVKKKYADDW